MKKIYYIPDTHDKLSMIGQSIIYYTILFILIYFTMFESDKRGAVMTIIAFMGFTVMSIFMIKIITKKENIHHDYLRNIILLSHREIICFLAYIVIIILSMCVLHPFNCEMIIFDIIIIIASYLSVIGIKYVYSWGMYINEKEICYILLKKHYINVSDIVGIKIEKAQFNSRGSIIDYKTSDEYIYCMLFLRKLNQSMNKEYYGTFEFYKKFPKSVIIETAYNAEVIDYFKMINPDIIVMSDIR